MRVNTNILVVGLLVLIVAGSLSLFTSPYPVVDFSSSTFYEDNIVIPSGKMVEKAHFELVPLSPSAQSKLFGTDSTEYSDRYPHLKVVPSKDMYLKRIDLDSVDSYSGGIYVYEEDTLKCTIQPNTDEDPGCYLKSGLTYHIITQNTYYTKSHTCFSSSDFSLIYCNNLKSNTPSGSQSGYKVAYTKIYYIPVDYPSDLSIKIGDENIYSKQGLFNSVDNTSDITSVLNTYCDRPSSTSECSVPVTFSVSKTGGKVQVNDDILLKDIPNEETSLSSSTPARKPQYYQYHAFSRSTSVRHFRVTIAERIKSIFSLFSSPPVLESNDYVFKGSEPSSDEEPPICKIIRIRGVCA